MLEQWGKYKLETLLAVGGMAEIFKASIVGPSGFIKPVCLKRVRTEFSSDPQFVEMFESEARIAAALHHSNIVQVFDFDRHDGQLFLAMELVEGLDLKQILQLAAELKLRVPISFAIYVVKGLLAALAHAHELKLEGESRPVIHRDVSPHNILVSGEGAVKLVDFGIAKAKGMSNVTRTGLIKGKLAYLSPEQARGEAARPGTDLFAAGLVLWEMLAGRRLVQGDDEKALIAQVLTGAAPPIPGIDAELNAVVMRLLDRNPDNRYESARQAQKAIAATGLDPCEADIAGELVTSLKYLNDELLAKETAPETDAASASAASDSAQSPQSIKGRTRPLSAGDSGSLEAESAPGASPPQIVAQDSQSASLSVNTVGWKRPLAIAAAVVIIAGIVLFVTLRPTDPTGPTEQPVPSAAPRVGGTPVGLPAESTAVSPPTQRETPAAEPSPVMRLEPPAEEPQLKASPPPDETVEAEAPPAEKEPAVQQATTPARRPRGKGFIDINVRPWARVKIDGIDRGTTPITRLPLRAGNHRVVLTNKALNYNKSFRVRVRSGQTEVLNKTINRPSGNGTP